MLWPLVGMVLFASLFFVKQVGMQYDIRASGRNFVPADILQAPKPAPGKECVVLFDSREPYSEAICKNVSFVLSGMGIGFDAVDLASRGVPKLSEYKTAVLSFACLSTMEKSLGDLFRWVDAGGGLLLAVSPEPSAALSDISSKLGLLQGATEYAAISKIRLASDFMLGGKGNEYAWAGNRYALTGQLDDGCAVHITSVGDTEIPLLWERAYGKGKVVVNNNDMFGQKQSRGLVAAAYSLLEDFCVYPVINSSTFFIDDFPAPISDGYNEWVYKDYKMSVDSFYTNIWFPGILELEHKYSLAFTGMLLETYDDDVAGPFLSAKDTDRLKYFGDLLLENKNEIGLHGYNHQPLVLKSYSFPSSLRYKKWNSTEEMERATAEALRFSGELFPGLAIRTYIAPSYILSGEARAMLKEKYPQITAISGSYIGFESGLPGGQEFEIGEDGIINIPHLISADCFDDDSRWLALNEMNFQYVNALILNPNDMLDPEYRKNDGWEDIRQNLDHYLGWLFEAAKGMRNQTAQESAKSVQRYYNLRVEKTIRDDQVMITLWGFYDEAWLMMRCGMGKPALDGGGTVTALGGDLYLIHAESKNLELKIERGAP